ncbi:zinc ribbon domain-containing protein [candidate division KSB1 bacterium]|nr:zinc ribbon domain-containing protein [candidate division KSB1 bacterium]
MPIYVYRCQACHNTHEALQKFSDPPLTICPSCRGALQKIISPEFGLSFKGSGFYITDYKKAGNGTNTPPSSAETKKDKRAAAQAEAG